MPAITEEVVYGQDQQIRIAIMNDIHEGRSPFFILNRAIEYIAAKTGEPTFAAVIKENIRSVYGIGLGEPQPLQEELEETRARGERLAKACETELPDEHKKRIEYAILAHRRRVEQLEKLLASSGEARR